MNIISLFSGIGGMDLGFELAGHNVIFCNDIEEKAKNAYILNFKKMFGRIPNYYVGDIKNISNNVDIIPDADCLLGGFPCQGFSVANLIRSMNDERNSLYLEILKIMDLKTPKFVVLENVKGLMNMEKGKIFDMILSDLERKNHIEYEVFYTLLNALDFGVPQNRERVFMICIRKDIFQENELFKKGEKQIKIKPTHYKNGRKKDDLPGHEKIAKLLKKNGMNIEDEEYRYVTLRDILSDLPKEFNKKNNHDGSKSKLHPIDSQNTKYVGHRPTYWDSYAPTIMGRGGGGGGPLIPPHPDYKRRLSVREVARIQTFPDVFEFPESNSVSYRGIGNAVPVLLAYNVAKILPL